jgi:hypothetical protein
MSTSRNQSQVASRIQLATGLSALLACWLLASSVWAGAVKPPLTFAQVVRKNFAKWDTNRDGVLSALEVDRVVKDPSVQGMEAAAIAAIHHYLRGDKAPRSLSESELLPESSTTADRRDVNDGRPHFVSDYTNYFRHLRSAPRSLFVTAAGPYLTGMAQGNLGDCYFVSTVGVAVRRNADVVRQMLHPNRDGSVDVEFPGGRTIHVKRLTDAEIALSSTAGPQGLWLNVLEKALSEVFLKLPKPKYHEGDIDLDVISRGGSPARTITLMTGHATATTNIRKKKGKDLPTPSRNELVALGRQFDELFSHKCAEGDLICAVTPVKGTMPPRISTHHVFAILDYNREQQIVHMWNPWGNNFKPKSGPDGLKNGYTTQQGRFDMPLRDFLRVFSYVVTESPEKDAKL